MDKELNLNHHISRRFNAELEQARNQIMQMGGLVETQLECGMQALMELNESQARRVLEIEDEVNLMQVEIDESCTQIVARRQPAASDLRLMIAIIKLTTDLERIGDEASKLGKCTLKLKDSHRHFRQFPEMRMLGDLAGAFLNNALNTFARLDADEALKLLKSDQDIDQAFDQVSQLLVARMTEAPEEIRSILRLNQCARALERIGDHAKNICEFVIYMVMGKDVRHNRVDLLD